MHTPTERHRIEVMMRSGVKNEYRKKNDIEGKRSKRMEEEGEDNGKGRKSRTSEIMKEEDEDASACIQ